MCMGGVKATVMVYWMKCGKIYGETRFTGFFSDFMFYSYYVAVIVDIYISRQVLFTGSVRLCLQSQRCLFPFRKQAMPFLTRVDAIIGNQAFSHDRCNICSEF